MNLVLIAQSLSKICEHSLVAPGRPLSCTFIINPTAGGYKIRSKWNSHFDIFNEYQEKALKNPRREIHKFMNMNITEGKGSAEKITWSVINKAEKNNVPFYLIISAGGDGTHGEVLTAVYNAPAHVRSNMAIVKLPVGTGNDGADNAKLAGALDLLINPVNIDYKPAVQLITASGGPASKNGPYIAFNILSVGLDAFVTHMTNKMKGKFPGDSYKLWVDIAALFYNWVYKTDYLDVWAFDQQNQEIHSFREKLLLLAMGVSGCRTYGSQQKVLPDNNNICALKQMPLYRKLIVKNQVAKGTHTKSPESIFLSANRLELSGSRPILAQMDGEAILLQPEDFPAKMELTVPVIPLLKNV